MLTGHDCPIKAAELFLDDISAEDLVEDLVDHEEDCSCSLCQVFHELLELERHYIRFLSGHKVPPEVMELCLAKQHKFSDQ